MKIYDKTHESKQALEDHKKKIEARGGSWEVSGKKIKYAFPSEDEARLPSNIQELVDARKVTYRGSNYGTRIKVGGEEYLISGEKFNLLGGIQKIRFAAPARKHT